MKLSRRDKQLLIFLAFFLMLAGLYRFGIEPFYLKLQQTRRTAAEKAAALSKVENKVRRGQALSELRAELRRQAGRLKASLNEELLDVPMPQRITAVTALAQAGTTRITNLRPLEIVEPETGQTHAGLIIEGETTAEGFKRFLTGLTGLHVGELSLTRSDERSLPLKFYLNGRIIPSQDFQLLADIEAIAPPKAVKDSQPAPIVTAPPPAPSPPPAEEPPKQAFDLSEMVLLGLFHDAEGGLAIIADRGSGEDHFLRVGEQVGDYRVSAIDRQAVELQNGAGATGRLKFPESTSPIFEQEPTPPKTLPTRREEELPDQPGRLGIRFKELTAPLAKSRRLPVDKGLLVLKGRNDVAGIQAGDVLQTINGTAVGSFFGARKALRRVAPGEEVVLEVVGNDNQPRSVIVTAL